MYATGNFMVLAKIAIYFGAQTGMNLYMKSVLSHAEISDDRLGMPAPFALTALQQITAFTLFAIFILMSHLLRTPYYPKVLSTSRQWLSILIFSTSFVLNIALNNYSLSLIPISTNIIIRSCLPLFTLLSQTALRRVLQQQKKGRDTQPEELALMVAGVGCAVVAVLAKREAVHGQGGDPLHPHFELGVVICLISIFSASINLAMAGVLGASLDLNPLDTTVYMALPAAFFLLGPIFYLRHPISWKGAGLMTDEEIFRVVLELSPGTVFLAVLSGGLALTYNVLTYTIVQTLSAAHTAMAGSFNNAATMVIALVVGMESLPQDSRHATILVLAIVGNIGCFAAFNFVRVRTNELELRTMSVTKLTESSIELEQMEKQCFQLESAREFDQFGSKEPLEKEQSDGSGSGSSESGASPPLHELERIALLKR